MHKPTASSATAARVESAASNYSTTAPSGPFLDMSSSTAKPALKARLPIPFRDKRDKPGLKPDRNGPVLTHDFAVPDHAPRFSPALEFAVSGKTASPLSELRDSYFPDMRQKDDNGNTKHKYPHARDRKGLKASNGSISIQTDFTGLNDRPVTPGGILDGYKGGGTEVRGNNGEPLREKGLVARAAASGREELGWAELLKGNVGANRM